jgi:hypothetical protein
MASQTVQSFNIQAKPHLVCAIEGGARKIQQPEERLEEELQEGALKRTRHGYRCKSGIGSGGRWLTTTIEFRETWNLDRATAQEQQRRMTADTGIHFSWAARHCALVAIDQLDAEEPWMTLWYR